jgi:O-antigen ligase
VLFVKFYPALGRAYHSDGSPMYTGIGQQKNDLGRICLLAGMFFVWELLSRRGEFKSSFLRQHMAASAVLGIMMVWLLRLSDSKTALVCLVAVVAILVLSLLPPLRSRPWRILSVMGVGLLVIWGIDQTFDLRALALGLLGRNPTLTNRTDVWALLLQFEVDPIIGAGFMTFWSGERMTQIWRALDTIILQAHNGYIEQYLNLGYVGVAFILIIMASGLVSAARHANTDPAAGLFRIMLIVAMALYNFTEASFFGVNNMWLMLLIGCFEPPRLAVAGARAPTLSRERPQPDHPIGQFWPGGVAPVGRSAPRLRLQSAASGAPSLVRGRTSILRVQN